MKLPNYDPLVPFTLPPSQHAQFPDLGMMGRFVCFMMSTAMSQMGRSKVTMVALSPESRMHSLKVMKMVLWSLGSPSMTGRKSTCVLCLASSVWIFFTCSRFRAGVSESSQIKHFSRGAEIMSMQETELNL